MGLVAEVADRCAQKNCFLRIAFQRKLFFSWPTSSGYASGLTPGPSAWVCHMATSWYLLWVPELRQPLKVARWTRITADHLGLPSYDLCSVHIYGWGCFGCWLHLFPHGVLEQQEVFCTRLLWCSWASGIFYFLVKLSRDGMPRYPGDDRHFRRELKVN